MKCPNDSATLVMSDRSGVEIDYCPECRGVWLDRGELDKIIERASSVQDAAPRQSSREPERDRSNQSYGAPQSGYAPKRKRENWLSELFE
jgi:Zn-finger nucleic acid-binding protein